MCVCVCIAVVLFVSSSLLSLVVGALCSLLRWVRFLAKLCGELTLDACMNELEM